MQPRSIPIEVNGASVQEERAVPVFANTGPACKGGMLRQHAMSSRLSAVDQFSGVAGQLQPQVSRNIAMEAFVNTCERWNLSHRERLILLGYGENVALGEQILNSRLLVTPQDARDRAGYLLAISVGLGTIYNEVADAERRWINLPHPTLGGNTPLAFMLEGRMGNILSILRLVEQERGID